MPRRTLFEDLPKIPTGFNYGSLVIEPLSITHAIIDFEAVVATREFLYEKYRSRHMWPLSLTLHDNIVDLGWHEKEFRDRASFAYTVTSPSRNKCFGCIYITGEDDEAVLTYWLRKDIEIEVTERSFENAIRYWLRNEWPECKIHIK